MLEVTQISTATISTCMYYYISLVTGERKFLFTELACGLYIATHIIYAGA